MDDDKQVLVMNDLAGRAALERLSGEDLVQVQVGPVVFTLLLAARRRAVTGTRGGRHVKPRQRIRSQPFHEKMQLGGAQI